ncbi:hypothetical protein [Leptospira sarikeiensis]|uniref:Tetratricopeptide repeat protein n=1 Tax=Leptospira sarikeiensis TaxID=2484943 RepID=A0A4V3JS97_9LEPT|nr:hypothetical protein [Leptospira sarikeiensis]TGL63790.1 hypothetical protein EHQ64_04240 [Leptospira sarikeiensis]
MDQDRTYEESIRHLSEGEFELARNGFDSLLEENPENPEYASGFYISSFWDHRIDRIHLTKEGRERTGLLLEFLKDFESVYKTKSYPKDLSYHSAMNSILQETTDQVRIALRKEGIQSLSPALIAELAYRLLLAEDTELASEVLRDSSGLEKFSPELLFFRAECAYQTGNHSQGLLLYRDAFLKEPSAIRLESVRSEPILSAINILREEFKEEGELKEALPVLLLERAVFKEIRKMSDKELEQIRTELFRLRDSLGLRKGGTEFKVKCRMIQLCCALLDSRTSILYGEMAQEAKRILDSLDPGLYHKRLKV